MIVVFDSGNWVSAIRFGGIPRTATLQALEQDRIAICSEIEEEIIRVMRVKFSVPAAEVLSEMATFLQDAIRVTIIRSISGICRDPKDDFILECAVLGNADFIVTGDKDLLSLESFGDVAILTPRQYLDLTP